MDSIIKQTGTETCPVCGGLITVWTVAGRTVRTQCETCLQKAQAEQAARESAERAEKRRQREDDAATEAGQLKIGIPRQYHQWTLTDFPDVALQVQRFYSGQVPLLTLTGTNGTGKTSILYALMRQYYIDGVRVKMLAAPLLLKELQALSGESVRQEKELIDELAAFEGALFLDDVGAEKTTPFTIADLTMIVSERDRDGRLTAVSTNLTILELGKRIDPRLADRLNGGLVVQMKGKSYRRPK